MSSGMSIQECRDLKEVVGKVGKMLIPLPHTTPPFTFPLVCHRFSIFVLSPDVPPLNWCEQCFHNFPFVVYSLSKRSTNYPVFLCFIFIQISDMRYRLSSQLHRAFPCRSAHPQSPSPSTFSSPFASLLAATKFLPTQPTNTVFFVGRRTICSRRSIGFQTFTPRFPHHLSSAKSFSTYSESMSVDNKGASKFLLTMSIVILRYLCSAYFFFFFLNR